MATEPTEPIEVEALQRQIAQLQAKLAAAQQANLTGSGAVAQDGGVAVGERAVKVEHNAGTIITGTQIVANYYAGVGGALS